MGLPFQQLREPNPEKLEIEEREKAEQLAVEGIVGVVSPSSRAFCSNQGA